MADGDASGMRHEDEPDVAAVEAIACLGHDDELSEADERPFSATRAVCLETTTGTMEYLRWLCGLEVVEVVVTEIVRIELFG